MVLDLPGGLFGQDDVRETNTTIPSGTSFLSLNPDVFLPTNLDTDQTIRNGQIVRADADGIFMSAGVNLPHGAKVTNVIVNGNISNETWSLNRNQLDGGSSDIMASGNLNSASSTITNPIIDNENNSYIIASSSLDSTDEIWGGVITYTI